MAQLASPPTDLDQPLSPEEVAQIRRHFAKYIVEAMPSIRRGLLGQEHWTTQRLGLFKTVASKVIPDLSASFSQHHHTHDDLSKLSRAELERIASGLAAQTLTIEAEALSDLRADLQAKAEVQTPPVEVLPDPTQVQELPDPRLTYAPHATPDAAAVDYGYADRLFRPGKSGRPRLTSEQIAAKTRASPLYALYSDPAQLKLAFSQAHHYYAYPPDGGDPQWLGPDPKQWCVENGFDRRAVARIAHGYPNMSRGVPYIQRSVRGWGFSCDLKGNFKPHKDRDGTIPGSLLHGATKAEKVKVKKRKLTARMTREERLAKIEEAREARLTMEQRIARAKDIGLETSARIRVLKKSMQKPKQQEQQEQQEQPEPEPEE